MGHYIFQLEDVKLLIIRQLQLALAFYYISHLCPIDASLVTRYLNLRLAEIY